MLNVGIVGSGGMANRHAAHWSRIPGAQVAGVTSLDELSVNRLSETSSAQIYSSMDELIEKANLDVIDICIPTYRHKDAAIKAIGAGIHTFIEKPLALSVDECDEIIAARDNSAVKVSVGHVLRYFPEYERAHEVIASGSLGQIATVRTARMGGLPKGSWNNWYYDPNKSGGVVLDLIIHDFDWLNWCFGKVERVYAKGTYKNPEYLGKLDYALVTLKFASGALGHVCGSWAHVAPFRTQFEVCGDKGMIEQDNLHSAPLSVALRDAKQTSVGVVVPESPLFPDDDPYFRELLSFAESIKNDTPPTVTLEDAREAVRVARAAITSIETNQPVNL